MTPNRAAAGDLVMGIAARPTATSSIRDIVGNSPWARQIRAEILSAAQHPASVLITGPSGTGKELIARAVHAHSARANKPFIPVDCASITGTLFASHMFGHLKGAFTGANYAALGCFRAADGGTIFLDEIGELEVELQAKLLRVLQQRTVVPVGSFAETPIDVRVIGATNRDLNVAIAAGQFRHDLYFRLNVIELVTSPLCDRTEDIPPLVEHILARLAVEHGMPLKRLSPVTLERIVAYSWPGNVRELENVLERAVMFSTGDVIGPESILLLETPTLGLARPVDDYGAQDEPSADDCAGEQGTWNETPWPSMADVERAHICRTLERTAFNQTMAAELLGMDRNLLRRKMQRYHLDMSRSKRGRPAKHSPRSVPGE